VKERTPSLDYIREFAESMPKAYRGHYGASEVAEHAGVALRRDGRVAHVERVAETQGAPGALCVVAEDSPGLLATISAALVLSGIDVIDAAAHTRKTPLGRKEAVDLFWVRYADPSRWSSAISDQAVADIEANLLQLLEGRLDREVASRRTPQVPAKVSQTTVRFIENADGDLSTLEVETDDRSGLLLALAQALFSQHVQIVESSVQTRAGHVLDRFSIEELDGKAINPARRLEIQVAVLSALQIAPRSTRQGDTTTS